MKYGKSDKGYFVANGKDAGQVPASASQAAGMDQSQSAGPGDGQLMETWNTYLNWLDKKGMKGKAELDKGGLGFRMMEEFNNEMKSQDPSFVPLTKQSVENVQTLQKEYRTYSMGKIKEGKAKVNLNGKDLYYNEMTPDQQKLFESDYFSSITKTNVDGNPGQYTTNSPFSMEFMREKDPTTGQKIGPRKQVGFARDKMPGQ